MLRLLRLAAVLIIILVSVYVWACLYVNWSGPQHWAQAKARLKSEGETLDFKKLLLPGGDSATNFCAIEALDGITLPGDDRSPQGRKRKALEELGWRKKVENVPFNTSGRAWAHKNGLEDWAKFARDTGFIQMPPDSGKAARDLLDALDKSQPLVKVLADAAVTRPNAVFTPSLRDRPLPSPLVNLSMPHLNSATLAGKALVLRALAANGCGDSAAATSSVVATLRFADALSQEPLLIDLLISLYVHDFAEEPIWSILEKRTATEEELRSLQAALEKLRFDQRTLAALRGELAVGIDFAAFTQSTAGNRRMLRDGDVAPSKPSLPGSVLPSLLPTGMVDENKAVLANLEYEDLIKPLKAGGYANLIHHGSAMEDELQSHRGLLHPGYMFTNFVAPSFPGVIRKAFVSETVRRQAVIACALERYYLQHKSYPATLAQLVPPFITAIPNDPMDDHPMRYRLTSDGRYMIWSVGFDQKDDDGKVNIEPKERYPAGKLYKSGYKGDWSWQYQPIK